MPNQYKSEEEMLKVTRMLADLLNIKKQLQDGDLSDAAKEAITKKAGEVVTELEKSGYIVDSPSQQGLWQKFKNMLKELWRLAQKGFQHVIVLLFLIGFVFLFLIMTTNKNTHEYIKLSSDIFFETIKLFHKVLYNSLKNVLMIDPDRLFKELGEIKDAYFLKIRNIFNEMEKLGISKGVFFLFTGVTGFSFSLAYSYILKQI